MLLLDRQAVIQDINPPATDLLGGKREEYLGKDIFALVDPADRYFLRQKWQNSDKTMQTIRQFSVRLPRSQGTSDWLTLQVETAGRTEPDVVSLVRLQHLFPDRGRL